MMIATMEAQIPEAQEVSVTGDTLKAELADGRASPDPRQPRRRELDADGCAGGKPSRPSHGLMGS